MALESPADAVLVAAYQRGDEGAALVLVRRHTQALSRFLYSSGAEVDDIEDLVQETFFRAFRRLDGWRGTNSLRSWLFTIAHNLLRDERRRRGRQVALVAGYGMVAPIAPADPHEEMVMAESEQQLRAGLAKLSRLQRAVFLLRVQGRSEYAEIAAALGTTPNAARVHYHHAVKRLKEFV